MSSVARNITLDGNTFVHSRDVEKAPAPAGGRVRRIPLDAAIPDFLLLCHIGQ
jgi:hypothetical protein